MACRYHSALSQSVKERYHREFQRDDAEVMVATVAFGMGIDKPNIRSIIHYGVPGSLEAYYQQVGRAGRDGLPSRCHLMWAPKDFMVSWRQWFNQQFRVFARARVLYPSQGAQQAM